jgi:hypothetical protein
MCQLILTSRNKWSHTEDYKEVPLWTPNNKENVNQQLTIAHETYHSAIVAFSEAPLCEELVEAKHIHSGFLLCTRKDQITTFKL